MKEPLLKESMQELERLLRGLKESYEENASAWNAYITDVQNCLLMEDLKGVRTHLFWMLETTSDFRGDTLKAISEFANVKTSK